jgi:hypothetical protein
MSSGGGNGDGGNGDGGNDGAKVGLTTLQFLLALVLIFALVLVAWYLINQKLIDKDNGPVFYADLVQGIVILGGAFFGIPITWRAAKSSGEAEGKAEGERGKEQELQNQRTQIATEGKRLLEQAMSGHRTVHDAIEESFSTSVGSRTYRLARDDLGSRTVEIGMDQLDRTNEALARLDQFMTDLQGVA